MSSKRPMTDHVHFSSTIMLKGVTNRIEHGVTGEGKLKNVDGGKGSEVEDAWVCLSEQSSLLRVVGRISWWSRKKLKPVNTCHRVVSTGKKTTSLPTSKEMGRGGGGDGGSRLGKLLYSRC